MPTTIPDPPEGAGPAGRCLWNSVLGDYELDEHELVLFTEAVRTTDVLAELNARVQADGALIDSPRGPKPHPAAVEARHQRITLARILAALRLPSGDEHDRPQRRSGVRQPYRLRDAS